MKRPEVALLLQTILDVVNTPMDEGLRVRTLRVLIEGMMVEVMS